ncbi:hypothetical protein CEUSTIGMA_g7006.t1 [Chlamydomonas eustigma]|uniref:Uncharacterized protein n=1 Tax=Chlamydomonas eustigma TaxID=1157962 RepID=A0A250X906_9CHLO|nr:hypothetical protein CEUSTIGMA_g7006.t1 [Chlamydomonas eustigma]|eukprot:GAX79565.1 hypothetical protein CEUSTIGMA_g7006.t1 [Chlamydomonas eustigma]
MQQQVNRFVAKPSCPTEDSPIPTQLYPSANICFLPKKAGGLSLPDLNSLFTAMRAKPCWKMFVRSVHPWQQLFRHEVTKARPAEVFGADRVAKQVLLKGPQTEDCYWEALPTGAMIPFSGEQVTNLATPPRAALVQYYTEPAYAWSREDDWNFHKAQQNLAVADRQRVLEPRLLGIWDEMDLDPRGWGYRREHHEDSDTNAPESAEERQQVRGAGQRNTDFVDIILVDMTLREARKALTHQAIRRRSLSAHNRVPGLTDLGALWPAPWSVNLVNPLQHTPPPTASESQLRMYGLEGLEERWRQPLCDDHFPPEELDQLPALMRPGASNSRRTHHASPSTDLLAATKEAKDVWQRLLDPTLHRPFAITCWHVTHGVLGCNAFLWHIWRKTANTRTSQLQQVQHTQTTPYCEALSCRHSGKHEDLTHAFLECPKVTPDIDWLNWLLDT